MPLIPFSSTLKPGDTNCANCAIIFHHIYKCAGTSMWRCYTQHHTNRSFSIYSHLAWAKLHAQGVPPGQGPMFLYGHEAWGAHTLLPSEIRVHYFTFLRAPVPLYLSMWRYAEAKCDGAGSVGAMLQAFPGNHMVRALGGGDLSLAQERLEQDYCVFGLVEQFPESMRMHEQVFGLDISQFQKANVTPGRGARSGPEQAPEQDEELLERISQHNRLDLELYAFAQKLFTRRRQALQIDAAHTADIAPSETSTERPDAKELSFTSEKARALVDAGDYARALDVMKQLPEDADFLKAAGKLAAKRGDFDTALPCLQRAFELHPAFYEDLADALFIHAPEKARSFLLAQLHAVQDVPPSLPDSALTRIRQDMLKRLAVGETETPEQALAYAKQGFLLNPDNFAALQCYVMCLRRLEYFAEATDLLERYLRQNRRVVEEAAAFQELAATLYAGGETKRALAVPERMRRRGVQTSARDAYAQLHVVDRVLSLADFFRADRKTVLIRCAPEFLLAYLCDAAAGLPNTGDIDLVTPSSGGDSTTKGDIFRRTIPAPGGMFTMSAAPPDFLQTLTQGEYDAALLLCSNLNLPYYAQWLTLTRRIGAKQVALFPKENALSGDDACFVLKHEAVMHATGGE